ncbi:MAG: RES domain-containing protein [Gammaproteobacteria bacterium]|jgi:hypothetical protein
MALQAENLPDAHTWWRIADPAWDNPLDPSFAQQRGGRWNPRASFPTLYLNEDPVTARLNLRAFIRQWPYEPEDLRSESGPLLVGAALPRAQRVADVHSRLGVAKAGLHDNYPFDLNGKMVPHEVCQPIGVRASESGLRGIRTRSAQSRDGAGRELAWFPATRRSTTRRVQTLLFEHWYRG